MEFDLRDFLKFIEKESKFLQMMRDDELVNFKSVDDVFEYFKEVYNEWIV